jgi:xanthine dehydrogenase accessory factor
VPSDTPWETAVDKPTSAINPAGYSLALPLVLIRGAGDLATGVALRLARSGFPVVMTEIERPLAVRRAVSFAQAVFDGETQVEEVHAVRCAPHEAAGYLDQSVIPVLVDPHAQARELLHPHILVDGIMAKTNTGTRIDDAPLVVALGPGFTAGLDCHAAIETNRGHNLGRVIWQGGTEPDTGRPGSLPGAAAQSGRVLRAPAAGFVIPRAEIGDRLHRYDTIAHLNAPNTEPIPITAPFDGVLRGLIHPSVMVTAGTKIGDLDPRIRPAYCFTVSDKSLAIGGGVLEAILSALHRSPPQPHRQDRKPAT